MQELLVRASNKLTSVLNGTSTRKGKRRSDLSLSVNIERIVGRNVAEWSPDNKPELAWYVVHTSGPQVHLLGRFMDGSNADDLGPGLVAAMDRFDRRLEEVRKGEVLKMKVLPPKRYTLPGHVQPVKVKVVIKRSLTERYVLLQDDGQELPVPLNMVTRGPLLHLLEEYDRVLLS